MLTMTQDAAQLVRTLTHHGGLPDGGGLRIVLNPGTHSLSMGLAASPEHADTVISRDGALLFLSVPAEGRTHGRTLCADIAPARSSFFLDS